jgi:hypothetical protein
LKYILNKINYLVTKLKFNKKGSIVDGIYISAIILALFLGFAMAKVVWDKTMEHPEVWNASTPEVTKVINRYNTQYMPMMDSWFMFAIVGGYLAVMMLAYFIRGSPVFLPIMVIIIAINTVITTMVTNAHDTIINSSAVIATSVAGWTMMNTLITNLPLISFFYLVALTIVMMSVGETI